MHALKQTVKTEEISTLLHWQTVSFLSRPGGLPIRQCLEYMHMYMLNGSKK